MIALEESATKLLILGEPAELDKLEESFYFQPKGYFFAPSHQRWLITHGKEGWDGWVNPMKRLQTRVSVIPRGRKSEVLAACDANEFEVDASKLIPLPFGELTLADVPPDCINAPFQLDEYQRRCVHSWLLHGIGINQVTVAGGKCLGRGTLVMLANGRAKPVENIMVGDRLMGPDSRPRTVLALGRGRDKLYRVQQANGESYTCNGDHLLAVQIFRRTGNFYGPRLNYSTLFSTITVDKYLELSFSARLNYRGYKVGVHFRAKPIQLDPYFLGLWLGDGSQDKTAVTTGDPEIVDFLKDYAAQIGLTAWEEKQDSNCGIWHLTTRHRSRTSNNPLRRQLRALGLLGAPCRWIPDVYKRNSRTVRLALLAGLLDSDGSVKREGQVEIVSIYRALADDICWLARSLGFSATVRPKRTTCQTGAVGKAFRVRISGDFRPVPALVKRKRAGRTPTRGLRTRFKIKSLKTGDYFGFEISGDGLFLLGDFTVTHNTAMFAAAARLIRDRLPEAQFLYLTPSERLVRQVTKEMRAFLPDFDVGQFGGGHSEKDAKDMVVCTVAMLSRHLDKLVHEGWFRRFMAVLFDECFVAGTLVDGKPIETLQVGDLVRATDISSWCTSYRRVKHVLKSKPTTLVRLVLKSSKSIVCTAGHPFYTQNGWKPAHSLTAPDMVVIVSHAPSALQKLPEDVRDIAPGGAPESRLLLSGLPRSVLPAHFIGDNGPNKSKVRLTTDDRQEPDVQPDLAAKSYPYSARHEVEAAAAGWQRQAASETANSAGQAPRLADGSGCENGLLARCARSSNALQAGHGEPRIESGRGGGRRFSLQQSGATTRLPSNSILEFVGVDRVEIIQRTSDGTFGGMCPDGFVYNLEVEGVHTYFAEGVLVHNCHHAGSPSSEKILAVIPAYFRLGASDTAKNSDPGRQASMKGLFGSFLNEVRAAPLVRVGRLAKPHIYVEDLKPWKNKFAQVPFRPPVNSSAWCLVESQWVKGRYLGPVYEKDADGKTVYRVRKDVRRGPEGELIREEITEPVIDPGHHRIEFAGGEHEIESRWCLLYRMSDEAVVRFKQRNELIVRWARYYSSHGLPTLVVCTRTLHVYLLEAALQKVVDPKLVDILFGWSTPKERDETFEWFRSTPGSILISPLVKEGVSINEIRAGVVADYVGDAETANQIVGRFLRKKAGNNFAEITVFRESQHPVLRRASARVIRAFSHIYKYPVYDPPPIDLH